MGFRHMAGRACLTLVSVMMAFAAQAADYPAPRKGVWIARDFKFSTGYVMPELRLGYTTVGEPTGEPVIILHGTAGSAASMLNPDFAGELFGRDSRWMRRNTTSSCLMLWGLVHRQSLLMG